MAVTTFEIFQSLLTRSVSGDAYLDAGTKASMVVRIADMPRQASITLTAEDVLSTSGNVSVFAGNNAITVADGTPGTPNGAVFDLVTFAVPRRVDGTKGNRGFLVGHVGESELPPVIAADMVLQYRRNTNDVWLPFNRNTVLDNVTSIQFQVLMADQSVDSAVPQLHIYAEQV